MATSRPETAKKAAVTRKRRAAARKAATTRHRKAAANKAVSTRERNALLRDASAILRFLPIFESPGYDFGEMRAPSNQLPFADVAPEVKAFVKALYDHGWIMAFDWGRWEPKAEEYFADPTKLNGADLDTIRKLLTLHARKDRFCEGHLLQMFENGHITAMLKQLAVLAGGGNDPARAQV